MLSFRRSSPFPFAQSPTGGSRDPASLVPFGRGFSFGRHRGVEGASRLATSGRCAERQSNCWDQPIVHRRAPLSCKSVWELGVLADAPSSGPQPGAGGKSRTHATLGCATLWLCPLLPNFAWLMAQPEGQTREPLSYQFQFVVCAHHGQSVDAGLDCARVLHGDIKHLRAVVDHGLTP